MGRVLPALLLLLLAACQQEPSFDERYAAAQKKVGTTAAKLETEMVKADSAAAADRKALEAAGRTAPPAAATPTT
ncbi:hypothetical protein PK98_00680 [Croceibacterium mercuriale]|uniref:Lipoprotein n=1 Tax=Croceibacterium mercuriale TaxID=1572751 RepID=A0A0B2BZL8_9SPHN|nr:hypothetical protein [Croceibacterium mercuriale]KHL25295.1 hypothetical protein PK98_00680 [Croceibacterium mercuriale]